MTVDTPWQHTTVLLSEAVDALDLQPDGTYIDATFGRGGHTRLMLSQLSDKGRVIAFDKTPRRSQWQSKFKTRVYRYGTKDLRTWAIYLLHPSMAC